MPTIAQEADLTAAESTQELCARCHLPLSSNIERCRYCTPSSRESLPARVGPYPVTSRIGENSHSRVYECIDSSGSRSVAVKVFLQDADGGRGNGERRLREARAWSRLGHAGITRVHSMGRWCNRPFLAMERVTGGSVEELLRDGARLEPVVALRIAATVAGALEAGAVLGLVHRGVRPANLLLDAEGVVHLSDPGCSLPAAADPGSARTGPAADGYAPEILNGKAVDFRADIYSLGMALGRMLGAIDADLPGKTVARSDPKIACLLQRMTAVDRDHRYQSWPEVREAITYALNAVDPAACERRQAASRGWASAGALSGFVAAAAISAFLPPPEPVLPGSPGARPQTIAGNKRIADNRESGRPAPPLMTAGPPGDAQPAMFQEPFEGPANYSYVIGSAETLTSFDIQSISGARKPRQLGGRVLIPAGQPVTWLHRSEVSGDVSAELDVVLNAGATASLLLRSADGREISVRIRAWTSRPDRAQRVALAGRLSLDDNAGVLLVGGNPSTPVAGVVLGVAPARAHHLELRRDGQEYRVRVDGHELVRGEIPFEGTFRVGFATATGGAELRSFAYAADREHIPHPAS